MPASLTNSGSLVAVTLLEMTSGIFCFDRSTARTKRLVVSMFFSISPGFGAINAPLSFRQKLQESHTVGGPIFWAQCSFIPDFSK
jgi:hypothetical protein